ncbi:Ferrichrome-iron receptor [Rhodovastum atsumiense]|uniref:TonB-dependent siderophore receptor n=1 Tax=Rhodovastum atsumiense TaxID=504468 RepID=A0A5M6ILE0_9PROT|nr:TonB-dependent siderophore receptor [Rhodovastum atsumiense]KAA5609090.1 TonB-dependent siderophore receptor [Rhodovastum atsumiense]CAH2602156.1 Ferrichrome-iron receptor [Rhodovastum atsumiense]
MRLAAQRRRLVSGLAGCAAALVAPPAFADPLVFDPVSVEGTRETGRGPVSGYQANVAATGTKTDTPLLETPQAISVITRDRMDAQNVRSVTDALRYSAGVGADNYGADVRGFYGSIRGFTPDTYLDGMRLPLTVTAQSYQLEPWGLERIDVIRGASSALYGSGNLGGLINGVSKVPRLDQVNQVQIQGGSFDRIQGAIDVGGKVNESGTLLWRLNALARDSGTGYDNIKNNRIFVAPSLSWQPDADTTVTLLASYQQDDGGSSAQFLPASGTVLYNPAVRIPRDFLNGDKNYDVYSKRQIGLGYLVEHRMSDAWTLRQSMRFTHIDLNYRSIYGAGLASGSSVMLNRVAARQQPTINTVTLDTQSETKFVTGPLGHDLLLGIDYRRNVLVTRTSNATGPQLNLLNPVYLPVTWPSLGASSAVGSTQVLSQVGIYAQDQLSLGNWRLILTGRQDFAQNDTLNTKTGVRTIIDDQDFTGRVALLYAAPFGVSPYVSYATSFLPLSGTNFYGQTYKPQTGDQVEVGVKYQPPGTSLLLTAALYDLRQRNVQTVDPANALNTVQTGEIRSRGIELEAVGEVLPRLNAIASFTYQEPEVTKTNVAAQLNKRPAAVPEHMASLWLDRSFAITEDISLGLGGGVRYTGNTAGDATNSFTVPSFVLFDMQVRLDRGNWRLQVNGTNLADKTYVAACSGITSCSYGVGRAVFASLGYRW